MKKKKEWVHVAHEVVYPFKKSIPMFMNPEQKLLEEKEWRLQKL